MAIPHGPAPAPKSGARGGPLTARVGKPVYNPDRPTEATPSLREGRPGTSSCARAHQQAVEKSPSPYPNPLYHLKGTDLRARHCCALPPTSSCASAASQAGGTRIMREGDTCAENGKAARKWAKKRPSKGLCNPLEVARTPKTVTAAYSMSVFQRPDNHLWFDPACHGQCVISTECAVERSVALRFRP
jgi:hypothetical protein